MTVAEIMQTFMLGPRLILSVREHHAELVANPDAGTTISSILFRNVYRFQLAVEYNAENAPSLT
jgi:hypothetical protein